MAPVQGTLYPHTFPVTLQMGSVLEVNCSEHAFSNLVTMYYFKGALS